LHQWAYIILGFVVVVVIAGIVVVRARSRPLRAR
jgi:uncharacterized membrane-anchored protein YhcB (DUF1043 family)